MTSNKLYCSEAIFLLPRAGESSSRGSRGVDREDGIGVVAVGCPAGFVDVYKRPIDHTYLLHIDVSIIALLDFPRAASSSFSQMRASAWTDGLVTYLPIHLAKPRHHRYGAGGAGSRAFGEKVLGSHPPRRTWLCRVGRELYCCLLLARDGIR